MSTRSRSHAALATAVVAGGLTLLGATPANASADPLGMPRGTLLVAQYSDAAAGGTGTVRKVHADGSNEPLALNSGAPTRVAVDRAQNVFFTTDATGDLVRVSPAGTTTTLVTGLDSPKGVAADSAGNVYVLTGGGGNQSVEEFSATGDPVGTVVQGLHYASGLTIDADDDLYVADNDNPGSTAVGTITVVPAGGTPTVYASGLIGAVGSGPIYDLAIAADGNVLALRRGDGVDEVDALGFEASLAAVPGASGLTVDPTGRFYVSSESQHSVTRFDADGSNPDVVLSNATYTYGLAVAGKRPQQVAFASSAPTSPHPGDTYDLLGSDGGSGESVTFTRSGNCDLSGSTITFGHPGHCVVTAHQAGNADYLASADASQDITVTRSQQSVTITSTATDPKPGDHYTVTTTSTGSTDAVVVTTSGACDNIGAIVTFGHPGSCTVTATKPADVDHDVARTTQTLAVTARAQTLLFDPTPTGSDAVVGNQPTVSATGGGSGQPVTFSRDASTTGNACSVSGATVTLLHPGSCVVAGDQAADADGDYAVGHATASITVAKAATSTAVSTTAASMQASIAVTAPGAGDPTGTVQFSVGGQDVGGPVTVHNGIATLNQGVPTGQTQQVAASYSGDADFLASSDSTARQDPTITASVSSDRPASGLGWYGTPVTVTFTCTTHGAALTSPCPSPVVLGQDGAGQSVSRTVLATDGGAATAGVSVDVDTTSPAAPTTNVSDGGAYFATAPTPTCTSSDAVSGLVGCQVQATRNGSTIRYVATATDRAGNSATTSGSFSVVRFAVLGAPFVDGRFQVRRNARYVVAALSSGSEAPLLRRPGAGRPGPAGAAMHAGSDIGGAHQWLVRWRAKGLGSRTFWVIGVQVGPRVHRLPIRVVG